MDLGSVWWIWGRLGVDFKSIFGLGRVLGGLGRVLGGLGLGSSWGIRGRPSGGFGRPRSIFDCWLAGPDTPGSERTGVLEALLTTEQIVDSLLEPNNLTGEQDYRITRITDDRTYLLITG